MISIDKSINCRGKLISFSKPLIMGILNLTPDSFYDGNLYNNKKNILERVSKMLEEGADIIDIGAYSSKPNAKEITTEEEFTRLTPYCKELVMEFPNTIFSIDTFRSSIAKFCIEEGFSIINDISGSTLDPLMIKTVKELQVPYIINHIKGTPQNMLSNCNYEDLIEEIRYFFSEKIFKAKQEGINDLIIDPGIGFSKTVNQNFMLLKNLNMFEILETPILIGISRKSLIQKTLNITANESL